MAKSLGVRFVAGEDERVLQVEKDSHGGRVTKQEVSTADAS